MSENKENQGTQYSGQYQSYPYFYQPAQSPAYYPSYNYRQFQYPQTQTTQAPAIPGMLPIEQSYVENILRLNRGKPATVYMTFENNKEWNAKIFKGVIEAAGRDHLILSDPQTGKRYLLLTVYLDYITFDEEINYSYPYDGTGQYATYSPR
ncbi:MULTISPECIES: spore coat protein GerQ [unclassified Virgibacillus]|uniref:spore coat protein GerQ n=1 Tax=unclassified Virgibacillus TaxID=2620237 RepID=UPI0024DEA1FC|nr:spore coat protein GerQ [Virgibacillus sp. LDC-1]